MINIFKIIGEKLFGKSKFKIKEKTLDQRLDSYIS